MPDLEVKVLGSGGRLRRGVSIKLDFTGEWAGLTGQHVGFSEGKYTGSDGCANFDFDSDYDGARFDLYVDHKREDEYNLGKNRYIEVNLYRDSDEEDERDD